MDCGFQEGVKRIKNGRRQYEQLRERSLRIPFCADLCPTINKYFEIEIALTACTTFLSIQFSAGLLVAFALYFFAHLRTLKTFVNLGWDT